MEGIRSAASFEGLAILAVIYFVLNLLGKAGKKQGRSTVPPPEPEGQPVPGGTQQEGFSLESVLREIERVKSQAQQRQAEPSQVPAGPPSRRPKAPPPRSSEPAPRLEHPRAARVGRMEQVKQDARGPLGRRADLELPSAEEAEDRTSFDDMPARATPWRPSEPASRVRAVVDQDEAAEGVVARRLREVEARNRPISAADHAAFDKSIRQGDGATTAPARFGADRIRQAFIWKEILGPPKSME
ncbi:MAG TPA: hypothetical protein VLD58_07920 [Gemmatimonadales bacterium]|nr:hypothetical protein [Gemmatimonadales bacterium]